MSPRAAPKDDRPKTPKPLTVKVVCNVCGMDWKAHGPKPTLEACVRLLKAELLKRPPQQWYASAASNTVVPLRTTGTG